jgi:hypothetical protein
MVPAARHLSQYDGGVRETSEPILMNRKSAGTENQLFGGYQLIAAKAAKRQKIEKKFLKNSNLYSKSKVEPQPSTTNPHSGTGTLWLIFHSETGPKAFLPD